MSISKQDIDELMAELELMGFHCWLINDAKDIEKAHNETVVLQAESLIKDDK